jgi:hypothetical protein
MDRPWMDEKIIFNSKTMNKVLFICILMIGFCSGQAQSIESLDVPAVVTAALKKDYPYATNVKWESQDGMYEASFKYEVEDGMSNNTPVIIKTEMAVVYSDKGIFALTETSIEISALPAGVKEYVAKNLMNAEITEASKIVNSQGMVSYEAEINKTDYIFTATGQFLRKYTEDGDEEDKD